VANAFERTGRLNNAHVRLETLEGELAVAPKTIATLKKEVAGLKKEGGGVAGTTIQDIITKAVPDLRQCLTHGHATMQERHTIRHTKARANLEQSASKHAATCPKRTSIRSERSATPSVLEQAWVDFADGASSPGTTKLQPRAHPGAQDDEDPQDRRKPRMGVGAVGVGTQCDWSPPQCAKMRRDMHIVCRICVLKLTYVEHKSARSQPAWSSLKVDVGHAGRLHQKDF